MVLKAQVKSVGQFENRQKKDNPQETYLFLPVVFKVGTHTIYRVDQMTGQVSQQDGDDDLAKQFIGTDAQTIANLNLQVGEVVNLNTTWIVNQYGRTEINVLGVWRDQPNQQATHQPGAQAPQPGQGGSPW